MRERLGPSLGRSPSTQDDTLRDWVGIGVLRSPSTQDDTLREESKKTPVTRFWILQLEVQTDGFELLGCCSASVRFPAKAGPLVAATPHPGG